MVVVLIAVAVVVFLILISGGNTPPSAGTSAYQSVVAHGQSGPVIPAASTAGDGGAGGAGVVMAPGSDIRQVDLGALVGDQRGGWMNVENTLYLDINGDGAEEALVLVRRDGQNRPFDWYLYGLRDNQVTSLFERTRVAQGELSVQGTTLVESEGIYRTGDPECCPSSLKRTFYFWKGSGLVVSGIEAPPPGAPS